MAARMQQRRGTASQWTSANPVLGSGEIGFETDTNKFKIGNGQAAWGSLPYFANVSDIIDGAPDLLNTLNELAAALGDDPNAITTIQSDITTIQSDITTIQSDISDLQSDKADLSYVDQELSDLNTAAQGYADTAESNAEAYTNALIGDVTVTGVAGNTVTARIAEAIADIVSSSPETLDALNELAAALGNDPDFATTVSTEIGTKVSKSGDTMSGLLTLSADPTLNFHAATKGYVDGEVSSLLSTVQTADGNLSTSIDTLNNDLDGLSSQVQTLSSDLTDGLSSLSTQIDNEIQTLSDDLGGDINNLSTQVTGIVTDVGNLQTDLGDLTSDVQTKAPLESPSFTGTAVLPTATSIGDVSSSEIGHLNGVTSAIQTQIDAKLDSGVASGTYAPINGPTFGGTVSLPSTTSIGDVSSTEIGYVNGVTSAIQTQIDTKAPSESPTFTGTVSGVTKTHVGLSNVDNTTDADKPISIATQTALDAKASLAGATFTSNVEVDGNLVVDGNLTVNGTEFIASATSITIEDNIIQIAHTNPANIVDLGVVVAYNDGTAQHAGIVRDVSANTWKLFKGVETEPATTVAFSEGSLDDLELNNIKAAGVVFTDGTQTKAGVPSLTAFVEKTASYTLDTLSHQDSIVEMNSSSPTTFTIPTNTALAWPVGASMDIFQTGTGEVTIVGDTGVTVNRTPGNKLRTQWSSATILKRGTNNWVLYGDLKA